MWLVYAVRCCDDSLYFGMTLDVDRRVREHNAGSRGAKYTRARRPVELVWRVYAGTRSEAAAYERQLKKLPKYRKEALVAEQACFLCEGVGHVEVRLEPSRTTVQGCPRCGGTKSRR